MASRIVAAFRASFGPGRSLLERAQVLLERLTPLGAVHVALETSTVTLAFPPSAFAGLLDLLASSGPDTVDDEPLWAIGIAQGDLGTVKAQGSLLLASGLLWSGPSMVAASHLAGLAHSGELLCADSVIAIQTGELVTSGLRIVRDGTLRIRGTRVERRQPWRRRAEENLARLGEPPLVAAPLPASADVKPEAGAVTVVRADPGAGGTRFVREIAARYPRSLLVSPAGSGFEPLGALRRALARTSGREVNPLLLELSVPLDDFLVGKGATLEIAAKLITAVLWPKQTGTHSVLVIDDATAIDPATLEACVRAVKSSPALCLVARLDPTGGLPSVLSALPQSAEVELSGLSPEASEEIARGVFCDRGALEPVAARRWARLGGGNALAIVESITCAVASGEIVWSGDRAVARSRAAGRGAIRPAAKWIRQRANAESTPARALLSLLALAGGEASVEFLARCLEKAAFRVDIDGTVAHLEASRWLVRAEPPSDGTKGAIAFPTRTHCKALSTTLDDETRRTLHGAIARVLDELPGIFTRVEGAWHASQASAGLENGAADGGSGALVTAPTGAETAAEATAAALVLLEGARKAAASGLESSATQLIALARRVDPSCEQAALAVLGQTLARVPTIPPPTGAPATSPSAPPPHSSRGPQSSRGPVSASPPASKRASAPPPTMNESEQAVTTEPKPRSQRAIIIPPGDENRAADALVATQPEPALPPPEQPSSGAVQVLAGRDPSFSGVPVPVPLPSAGPSAPPPDPAAPGAQIALRMGELARDALLSGDNASLERWVDGLTAAGESPAFTERMRAMARLGRGDIGDALRVLRRTRSTLDPNDHRRRCQTSLALGVALSGAGRPQDALLEGLDALARARQVGDERGTKACLAFLAKLYTSVARGDLAEQLRERSLLV